MIHVPGIYDGKVVRPAKPLAAPPNSPVVITLGGEARLEGETLLDFLERQGRLASRPSDGDDQAPPSARISVMGPPVSQTILEDRGER